MDLYDPFLPAAARHDPAPVVALHSSGASAKQWQRVREAVGRRAAFITPDFHGHGAAPAWHGTPRAIAAADAALVLRELDALGRPVHLVGHSYGGAVALAVALARPRLVRTLTLYEPVAFNLLVHYNPRHAPAREVVAVGRAIGRRVARGEPEGAAALFVSYWSGEAAWAAMPSAARAALANRMGAIAGHFESLFAAPTDIGALGRLQRPVLLVTGERPHAPVRRVAELLSAWLPQVASARIRHAGHMGPVTHPDAFAGMLGTFLGARLNTVAAPLALAA
jgi:pimeloyl-ACP methyl ester carboxylesterase